MSSRKFNLGWRKTSTIVTFLKLKNCFKKLTVSLNHSVSLVDGPCKKFYSHISDRLTHSICFVCHNTALALLTTSATTLVLKPLHWSLWQGIFVISQCKKQWQTPTPLGAIWRRHQAAALFLHIGFPQASDSWFCNVSNKNWVLGS